MAALLERIRRAARPPLHALPVVQARAAYEAGAEVLDLPRAPLAEVADFEIAATDGTPLRARRYAAQTGQPAPTPTLLYLHGGGFVVGSLETHDSLCRQLALRSGWVVVALDYRLAPEHRFPTAVDDAWAAMVALATSLPAGTPLAVGGDSAGGTLAAVCALHARDIGLPLVLQLLITPGTAARGETASRRLYSQGFLLEQASIDWSLAITSTMAAATTGASRRSRPTRTASRRPA